MAGKKNLKSHAASKPAFLFRDQLAGETAPSLATMEELYRLASDLASRRPWTVLAEDQLVLVEQPSSKELCFCSIMGVLGQVLALQAYLGADGFRFFKRLRDGEPMTAGEFFDAQRSVSVEFVKLEEATPPDRELLRAMDHPLGRGMFAPIFRSIRPGYHAWYVTQGEAEMLAECQRGVLMVLDLMRDTPSVNFWERKDTYPLVARRGEEGHYEIRLEQAPEAAPPTPALPKLDEERIRRIREARLTLRGILEADSFCAAARIGEQNARKACVRIGIAIDAETGFAYPPEVGLGDAPSGDLLVGAVLQAIEKAQVLPQEIHVRNGQFQALLQPLAEALGYPVKLAQSLPALENAKSQLLQMMERSGIPAGSR